MMTATASRGQTRADENEVDENEVDENEADENEADSASIARVEQGALAFAMLLLLYFSFHVFAFVKDDAFITYRYAWHLRHGYGPVFNPGERVEGYSCPLFMALTALLMWLPGDPLLHAKWLGLACGLATLWALQRLACELRLPRLVCAAAPLLLAANASFALSVVDGMETGLQALLVTLAALLLARERRTGYGPLSALTLLAAALNRTEGAIYFVAAVAAYAPALYRNRPQSRDALWALTFLAPYLLFLLWRHSYYGEWLPNTVHAKSMPLTVALRPGLGPAYLLKTVFLKSTRWGALASCLLWLLAIRGGTSPLLRRDGLSAPIGVMLQALVALRSGGDWMEGWRYMAAATPLWTLLIAVGLHEIASRLWLHHSLHVRTQCVARCYGGLALCLICVGWEYRDIEWKYRDVGRQSVSWAAVNWTGDARQMLEHTYMRMFLRASRHLNALLPPGATVAYSEMGVVPYYTPGLRWLDTAGLTDHDVAHLKTATHGRTGIVTGDVLLPATDVGQLLLRRRPDYIMLIDARDYPHVPVLNGAYLPRYRVSLGLRYKDKGIYLLIWQRRME